MAQAEYKKLDPEDSNFIPEVERDEMTGDMIDVATGRKQVKQFKQKEHIPLTEYGG